MSRFTMRGRVVAAIAATLALAGVLVPGADAQKVMTAGPFVITPTAGSMSLGATPFDLTPRDLPQCSDGFDNDGDNKIDAADPQCAAGPNGEPKSADDSEVAPGFQAKQDVELSGTVDTDGNVTIPTSGVKFPTVYIPISIYGNNGIVRANVVATHPATGTLNPITGAADLRVRLKVELSGGVGGVSLGYYCTIGTGASPIDITLTTGTSTAPSGSKIYGASYKLPQGALTVVSNNFAVPGASNCGDTPAFINPIINSQVGIPSARGNSKVILSGTVNPAPQAAVVASATATPQSGPAPHSVTLDASASTVAKQPAKYEWTLPDGSVETGKVVQHTFTDQGTKVVDLRVSDADGDSDVKRLQIEVGPASTTTTTQPPTTTTTTQPTTTTTTAPSTTTTTTAPPTTTTTAPTTTTTAPTTTTTTTAPTTTTTTQPTTTTTAPTTTTTTQPTTTTTTAPSTTTTTTTAPPGSGPDELRVTVVAGSKYEASGTLTSGDFTVESDGGTVRSVRGAGSIDGPTGGSARVGIDIDKLGFLPLWFGRVSVVDRAAGVNQVVPYIGQLADTEDGASGTARGIQWVGPPRWIIGVSVGFSVRDLG